ncbi:MAG: hypothetical protein IKB08_00130 [Clostridia bacterium]|nr:hypothetical protein [Clostridia bacterium]
MKLKKFFNGIIAVLLTAFLITGSFPAYLLNASAANEMSVVTIADISTPYPDTRPDYTAVYCDGVQKPDIPDSETQKNGISWRRGVKNSVYLSTTARFAENVQYTVSVAITAQPGFTFSGTKEKSTVTCYINGNKANVTAVTGQDARKLIVATFTFPASEYYILGNVGVKNIDIPKVGESPDFTGEPVSDRYIINGIDWKNETKNKILTPEDVFEKNCKYSLTVWVRTLDGQKLKTDSEDMPDFTAKINGTEAEVIYAATGNGKAAGITATYSTGSVISEISVSGIEIPKAGNRADYTCSIDEVGYELDTYGIDWTTNSGYGSELPVAETFKAGQFYELKVWLIAKEGYTFKTNSDGEVIADVKINGLDGDIYISDSKRCQITYVFRVPADITAVGVTDIAEPFSGGTADTEGTVTGNGYEISKIEWFDSTDGHGHYINNITSFSEGREYTLEITLKTVSNNSFSLDADYDIPDISASVNGKSAGVYSTGGRDEAVIFRKFKTPVEKIEVTGIDTPAAGNIPDTEAVSTKAGYEINKVEWFDSTTAPLTKLSETDKFIAGHKYTVQVTLYAVNDYIFHVDGGYQEITGTVNGNDAIEYGSHEYGTAVIGYEFSIPAPHIHTPSDWKKDADGHWKECTDESCKAVVSEKTAHEDKNGDEKCDSCAYPLPKPVISELVLKKDCTYTVSHSEKTVIIPAGAKISDVKGNILNDKFSVLTADGKAAEDTAPTGTGMKIQILGKNGEALSEYRITVLYDTDGNGIIQASDARIALRVSVELEKLEGEYFAAADINETGKIEAVDARSILRKSVGLE